jgi:hypothetical protein
VEELVESMVVTVVLLMIMVVKELVESMVVTVVLLMIMVVEKLVELSEELQKKYRFNILSLIFSRLIK